jgi:hypothetical protein
LVREIGARVWSEGCGARVWSWSMGLERGFGARVWGEGLGRGSGARVWGEGLERGPGEGLERGFGWTHWRPARLDAMPRAADSREGSGGRWCGGGGARACTLEVVRHEVRRQGGWGGGVERGSGARVWGGGVERGSGARVWGRGFGARVWTEGPGRQGRWGCGGGKKMMETETVAKFNFCGPNLGTISEFENSRRADSESGLHLLPRGPRHSRCDVIFAGCCPRECVVVVPGVVGWGGVNPRILTFAFVVGRWFWICRSAPRARPYFGVLGVPQHQEGEKLKKDREARGGRRNRAEIRKQRWKRRKLLRASWERAQPGFGICTPRAFEIRCWIRVWYKQPTS